MRSRTNNLAFVVAVACFVVLSRGTTDRDAAIAQGPKPVVNTRIYTGPDGLAHAEDVELKLNSRGATEMLKATGAEFSVRRPTAGADPRSTAASTASDPVLATTRR